MGVPNIALRRQKAPNQSWEDARFQDLVTKAMKGNSQALCTLCEEVSKGVYFRIVHLLGTSDDAEDVLQEVMLRVCEKIADLRNPQAFVGWLGTITANEARQQIRKNAGLGIVLDIDDYLEYIMEDNRDFLPQMYTEREEYSRIILEILDTLPRRQREAIFLYYYDGLGVVEVAAAMGITAGGVSQYLALAREKIKAALESKRCEDGWQVSNMTVVPFGAVLKNVLQQETEKATFDPDIFERINAKCEAFILKKPAIPKARGSIQKVLAGGISAVVATAGIVFGINSIPPTLQPENPVETVQASGTGRIAFHGGIDSDEGQAYRNPTKAVPLAASNNGEIEVIDWQITVIYDDEILFSGEGGTPDSALVQLLNSSADGKYMITFTLKDEAGVVYKMFRNFLVET
jgi:RNA polymerase sigma-70 factor (ECF subfamily)